MAVITPNSDVILLKVPLEIDEANQLTFANTTAQYNYFNGLTGKKVLDNYTYVRKDGVIRVNDLIDNLYGYNYVMYRNTSYGSKWFYAFITGLEYLNDSVTAVKIKTDVWQTWFSQIQLMPVLVDREHVSDDTIGLHTYPENLELGEMKCNDTVINFGGVGGTNNSDYVTVVEVSQVENDGDDATLSYSWASGSHSTTPMLNSIFRGTIPLVLGLVSGAANTPSVITNLYDRAGLSGSIINIYMLPKDLIGTYNQITLTVTKGSNTYSFNGAVVPSSKSGTYTIGSTQTFTRPAKLDNYTPKNNKMYCWPFCYFNISNNAGTCQSFRYEDFSSTVSFAVEGTFGISGNTKAIPQNYLNVAANENALDYSVTGPKYPVCSWNSDSYTNWLTQNSVNMERDTAVAGIKGLGAGIGASLGMLGLATATGGAIGAGAALLAIGAGTMAGATPVLNTALDQMKAKTTANMIPDQVGGNTGAGDFLWAKYRSPFTYMSMSVKAEYAKICDDFMSMYGYKVNTVKTPNVTGRTNWNYVKTIGSYIKGDIPQDDLQEMKSMFDNGITFWHNPLTFGDYTQSNSIVV